MRIVFRVEGNLKIGLGHMMRCLALAQGLTREGHQVKFITSQASQEFCQKRNDWVGKCILIEDMPLKQEAQWLKAQCENLAADWLILDGYQFDQTYRQILSANRFKFAVFDDLNDSGQLHADLVINGANNAQQLNYLKSEPKAKLAIGSAYQVLRQEFLDLDRENWSQRKTLTLMFGGSDTYNLTLPVLQNLIQSNLTLPIVVVTGAAYSQLNKLSEVIQDAQQDISHIHDCQNMAEILLDTKLAVSAAGGSQFELLACATPAILVVVAKNQITATQHALTQAWCQVINNQVNNDHELTDQEITDQELTEQQISEQVISLWQQTELLHTMHSKALELPVPDGAKNIVNLMFNQQSQSVDT
ncbi:UDP-2,4-diacetamido-2,4,6-trideoxy-beta-L-altropyranose hydrolase [Paraglaciecola aquimarina]|uniref:UDP-2,4-diacetamido-2,4, 6-trideoxy-beta-L-altropyranose hydrolase n=2 Tax=Paraglaciecola algarum TaxID=3050085 RepID=A0ABS9D5B9_9ALTE|nr:UDP-2,4-diacetamido-2,4,6-trideoxy-beta-L-altropyranose hydrolase [Paraglaciecola sp. G1-23]